MSRPSLTVFIITLNAEKHLERCLKSVKDLGEIHVVDGGSRDRTVQVAERYARTVRVRPFDDFGSQKNYALSGIASEWALSLDADEEVSGELKSEIQSVLADPKGCVAFRIRRKSWMFGRLLRFTGTQNDKPIRLFIKAGAAFTGSIHETVQVKGACGELKHSLIHYTYSGVSEYMAKLNHYTRLEADVFKRERRKPEPMPAVWLKVWGRFIQLYFLNGGFRDGMPGFVFSFLSGYYFLIKHLKHRESVGLPS